MDKSFFNYENFKVDNIRSVDAKFEAQKIAFAPLAFQAINAMLELGMNVIKLSADSTEENEKMILGKIGWMLLEDDLTHVNFRFTNDICYQGAFNLKESVKNDKPEGLKIFGDNWTTVYEALSTLPEKAKKAGSNLTISTQTSLFPKPCR